MVLVRKWLKDETLEQIALDQERTVGAIKSQLVHIGFELD